MINRSDSDQRVGDATYCGIEQQKGVLHTPGENSLARKAAGAQKVPGVQPARGNTTRFGDGGLQAVGTKQLSLAAGKTSYVVRVVGETYRTGSSTTRPDGEQLPPGPNIDVVSREGHQRRVAKGNLRPELQLYLLDKRTHFGDSTVFLGTQLDGEDVVLSLSGPCCGLLEALMLGHANRQTTVYHPASKECLQVPDSRELSRIAAACSYAERKTLPDALACVDASLRQLSQDVCLSVLDLITAIRFTPPADVTDESLEHLQTICKRASEVDGGYASWLGVAMAHVVHQREKASAEPSGERVLLAAV